MNKIVVLTIIILSVLCSNRISAQEKGCTDPRALNFSPAAQINDASCIYPATTYKPEVIIPELPISLIENSGMILWDGLLWFHNDSGHMPELYALDTLKNEVVKTVRLTNANNRDWEDICHDSSYIYIGDFGNNAGVRKDLKIYRIDKDQISKSSESEAVTEIIEFQYPDQISFEPSKNHNFDCEAFLTYRDSLYLFTKNRGDNKTKVYSLPKTPGTYEARLTDSFNVQGLVTSVALNKDSNILVLLGYHNYRPFIFLFFDFRSNHFFHGSSRRIDMPGIYAFQTEALYFTDQYRFLFSSEKTKVSPNRLFAASICQWTCPVINAPNFNNSTQEKLVLLKDYRNNEFFLWTGDIKTRQIPYTILNDEDNPVFKGKVRLKKNKSLYPLKLSTLEKGAYQFVISTGKFKYSAFFSY